MALKSSELALRLRDVIGFPVTPFTDSLDLDLVSLQRNLRFMVDGGIRVLVVTGGTGELYSLTADECRDVYRAAQEAVGGRCTLIAGVGGSFRGACDLATEAERLGFDGILMLPAAYGRAEDSGMLEYYAGIARSVQIGVLPYARDWAIFSPDLVARLAEVPNVVAFKDGQGDLRTWTRIRARVRDRLVWLSGMGDDVINSYFAAGAEGFTSSIANFSPDLARSLFAAAAAGNFERLNRLLDEKILDFYWMRQRRRGYEVSVVKEAMNHLGLHAGLVRPPLANVTPEEKRELAGLLERIGVRPAVPV